MSILFLDVGGCLLAGSALGFSCARILLVSLPPLVKTPVLLDLGSTL